MSPRAPLLALKDVRLQDGPVQLFDGVDLALEPRVRATLVGRNGAGKSTLMRIVAGMIEPDGGERTLAPSTRIAFVPQEPVITGATLRDYAASGAAEPWAAEAALETFGLDPAKAAERLSGGEARRAALARAFAEEPDVLLLDEPTNHLDIFAIETLEAELRVQPRRRPDRQPRPRLPRAGHRALLLAGGPQGAAAGQGLRRLRRLGREDRRRAGRARCAGWTRPSSARPTGSTARSPPSAPATRAARASCRPCARRAARLMKDQPKTMELTVDSGATSGQRVADAKAVSKQFGERRPAQPLLHPRAPAATGSPSSAPTAPARPPWSRCMLGEIAPDAGEVKLGTGLEVAYLDQARETLTAEMTLWDALVTSGGDQVHGAGAGPSTWPPTPSEFLFQESQLRQPVASLSGGERNRLLLARALARPANLLVLDEPTNDLDMDTLDLLEEALGRLRRHPDPGQPRPRLHRPAGHLHHRPERPRRGGGDARRLDRFRSQNPGFFDEAQDHRTEAPGGRDPPRRGEEARQALLQGPAPPQGARRPDAEAPRRDQSPRTDARRLRTSTPAIPRPSSGP